jgi:DNA-binding response OmpR family regulator
MARILLIDDDDPFRIMLKVALTQSHHEVVEARDGRKAIALFAENPAELVITDIIMPDKDGLEILPELRRKHPAVKIIAMSGGGRINAADFLKIAKMLGADRTLSKPFPLLRLITMVNEMLAGGPVPA